MDLALSVVGLAAGELIEHSLREPLGRPPRLLQGVLPCAAKLHDLGAMDEAETVVGDHLRLSSHHRVRASVHSRAWRSSYTSRQKAIVLQ